MEAPQLSAMQNDLITSWHPPNLLSWGAPIHLSFETIDFKSKMFYYFNLTVSSIQHNLYKVNKYYNIINFTDREYVHHSQNVVDNTDNLCYHGRYE
jgi:hypothetical protein